MPNAQRYWRIRVLGHWIKREAGRPVAQRRPPHENGLAPFSGGENTGASASRLSRCVFFCFCDFLRFGRPDTLCGRRYPPSRTRKKAGRSAPLLHVFFIIAAIRCRAGFCCAAHLSRARAAGKASGAEGSALQIQRKFVFAKFSKVDRSGSMRRSRSPPLRSSSISRSAETAEMFAYPGA